MMMKTSTMVIELQHYARQAYITESMRRDFSFTSDNDLVMDTFRPDKWLSFGSSVSRRTMGRSYFSRFTTGFKLGKSLGIKKRLTTMKSGLGSRHSVQNDSVEGITKWGLEQSP
jgi:hypothetical protein